jgi:hypothetical protein
LTEEPLQVNLELAMIEERPSAFLVDQKIHVAVRARITARH